MANTNVENLIDHICEQLKKEDTLLYDSNILNYLKGMSNEDILKFFPKDLLK